MFHVETSVGDFSSKSVICTTGTFLAGNMHVEDPFERGIEGLWGKQRGDVDETWDVHKAGYKEWQIEQLLEENGFENIEWIDSGIKHYHVKATKK